MKISYKWLSDFISTDITPHKMADILTDIGLEVEGTEKTGVSPEDLEGIVVGKVLSCEQHPNADKLKVTQVDIGPEKVQIVCGAPNVAEGQLVPVATVGAEIKTDDGGAFKIKKAKLRGEASHGMICSQKELKLGQDHAGIWVLEGDYTPGTPVSEIVTLENDYVFEIGLTPNRADAMSHMGVARDLYAALNARKLPATFNAPEVETISSEESFKQLFSVHINDEKLCPRYCGIYLTDIEIKPSPAWLQQRLNALGISPKNNVVDITNYVLHAVGQPMHAFDVAKLEGNKIVVKSAKKGSKFTTLDEVERTLEGHELMIYDAKKPIGMAGVMGGLDSSVTATTQEIFLESAYFEPVTIRKSAKSHALNSDSSFRFERGIDPNFTAKALWYAVDLLQKHASAKIAGEIIDVYPTPIQDFTVALRYRKVDELLGERIHRQTIKDILSSLDIEILSEINETLDLRIPPYRVDVQREVDVIEEILRIYGYNQIALPEKMKISLVKGEGYAANQAVQQISQILVAHGFHEAMNMSMYKADFNDWLNLPSENTIGLLNSLSNDLAVMRRSLLPGLMQNIAYNINRKNTNIKLFEWGKSYKKQSNQIIETPTLALAISGNLHSEHWKIADTPVSELALSGWMKEILTKIGLHNPKVTMQEDASLGECLYVEFKGKTIGKLAKVSKNLCKKFEVNQDVFYAEFYTNELLELAAQNQKPKFKAIPKFPEVRRDLALLLDKQISYQEIQQNIEQLNIEQVKNINLFDVYEGDKIPDGKKSYAISLYLQNHQKTMQDKEIDAIMQKIIAKLSKEINAELRT